MQKKPQQNHAWEKKPLQILIKRFSSAEKELFNGPKPKTLNVHLFI